MLSIYIYICIEREIYIQYTSDIRSGRGSRRGRQVGRRKILRISISTLNMFKQKKSKKEYKKLEGKRKEITKKNK